MARILSIILPCVLLISCSDFFSTRDPEDPQGNSDSYLNESVTELKDNFKTSLLGLDLYLYESLFINDVISDYLYSYICQASDISQPGIFSEWNIESEKIFMNGLKASSYQLTDIELFNNPVDETADSAVVNIEYSMLVTTPDASFSIKGNMILDLLKIDGHFWYIRTWTDISPQGNISFSKIKEPYAF